MNSHLSFFSLCVCQLLHFVFLFYWQIIPNTSVHIYIYWVITHQNTHLFTFIWTFLIFHFSFWLLQQFFLSFCYIYLLFSSTSSYLWKFYDIVLGICLTRSSWSIWKQKNNYICIIFHVDMNVFSFFFFFFFFIIFKNAWKYNNHAYTFFFLFVFYYYYHSLLTL